MGFAEAADVPVVLIGDIERGGVIAQLVGTSALLSDSERVLLAGYIVNKFRGDVRLFDAGIAAIGERTGLRSFGVVPYFAAAELLPAEDSLALDPRHTPTLTLPRSRGREWEGAIEEKGKEGAAGGGRLKIAVPLLPRIANFDDLDPLRAEPAVEVVMVRPGRPLPRDAALVVLPGSKATVADLEFLRGEGWDIDLLAHRRQGGRILGLCGGYQMLGRNIADPLGLEGRRGKIFALGLLDIETVLSPEKRLGHSAGIDIMTGMAVAGYEMHLGATTGPGLERPMLRLADRSEGAVSADGLVAGCYLHGLFANDRFRRAFLESLGAASVVAYEHLVDTTLDALADHLEQSLDLTALLAAARPPRLSQRG
jgi:adenosylcobyric acid synthase